MGAWVRRVAVVVALAKVASVATLSSAGAGSGQAGS
jgi:hypothetical protein